MASKVLDDRASQADRNVRPSHARHRHSIELVLLPLRDIVEVKDTGVIVVLSGEDGFVDVGWMHIGNCVLVSIPSAEAQIQAAHESDLAVNKAQFLVVSPV